MITDERVAKFIDTCRAMGDAGDGARYDWWDDLTTALTELQAIRSKPVAGVEDDAEPKWRDLALQFDGHRIEALGVIRAIVRQIEEYATVRDVLREPLANLKAFLAKPPLSGDAVLADRISTLSLPTQEPAFYGVWSGKIHIGTWPDEKTAREVASEYDSPTVVPLYASPQPTVITDEMVERAHAAYAKTVGGTLNGQPMRNALIAALVQP